MKALSLGVALFLILAVGFPIFFDDCEPAQASQEQEDHNHSGDSIPEPNSKLKPDSVPKEYEEWISRAGSYCTAFPAPVIAAQIQTESDFRDLDPNHAKAEGPAQWTPAAWKDFGIDGDGDGKKDPRSIADSVISMGKHNCDNFELAKKQITNEDVFGDPFDIALAHYNAGRGTVQKHRGVPNYQETKDYITRIKDRRQKYEPNDNQAAPAAPAGTSLYAMGNAPAADPAAGEGKVVVPLPKGTYRITSRVGPRDTGIPGASKWHQGVDFGAARGTPILAATDGEIQKAGKAAGFGQWIVQKSDVDGSILVYGHMHDSTKFINAGDRVTAGQQIASVSNNGIGGVHLHFEWWPGGQRTGNNEDVGDPLEWFKETNAENLDRSQIPDVKDDDAQGGGNIEECEPNGDTKGGDVNSDTDVTPPKRNDNGSWPNESCSEDDITQPDRKGACLSPRTKTFVEQLRAMEQTGDGLYCWDPHLHNPSSDHPKGKACDITYGKLGKMPTEAQKAEGDSLADWMVKNADTWGVKYVIWYGQIWTERTGKWKKYGGGGVYDTNDPTGGHFDHIHVSLY